jgi:hypothetical protein
VNFEWDIGVVLNSAVDADGFTTTQRDAYGEGTAQLAPQEIHHPYGFMGRPGNAALDANQNPDPTQANQLLYAMEGGAEHHLALEHPAIVQLLPTIEPLETLFYGPKGQFIRQVLDGSFVQYSPAPDGGSGQDNLALFGNDVWSVTTGFGSIWLDDTGFHVALASGATFDLGVSGDLPGPLSAVSSYCKVTAGSFSANASAVSLGASATGTTPLPNATWLLAEITAIKVALTTIASTMQAGTVGGPTAQQFATAALVTAACEAVLSPTPVNLYTNTISTY